MSGQLPDLGSNHDSNRPLLAGWVEQRATHHRVHSNNAGQCLSNILNDIVNMLYAYRYSDKTLGHS